MQHDTIACETCGTVWAIHVESVRWRCQERIHCEECGHFLLKEQGHRVVRLQRVVNTQPPPRRRP